MADDLSDTPRIASDERIRTLAALFVHDAARFDSAGKGLAGANCSVEMPITGHSMGATLLDGTVARVWLGDGPSCLVGDVVVFRQGEQLVAHRVLYRGVHGRAAHHLITRGDARIAPDPPVPFGRILGRVTGIVTSSETLLPARMHQRHWFVRFLDAAAMVVTVLTLHMSPAVAVRSTRLLTTVERWSLPMSLLRRVRRALLAASGGRVLVWGWLPRRRTP